MASDSDQETDLRHIAGVLRQRAWIAVLLMLVAGATAYGVAKLSPTIYQATAEIQLVNPNTDQVFQNGATANVDPKRLVDTQTGVIQSDSLRATVDQQLGADAAQILGLAVTNEAGTDLLDISVTSQSPQVARDAANAFANLYLARRKADAVQNLDQRATELRTKANDLTAQIQQLDQRIAARDPGADALLSQRLQLATQQNDFNTRANQFEVESSLRGSSGLLVDPATLPTTPISPKPVRDMALAAALGLLLGIGLILLLDRLNDRVNSPDDLEAITGGVPMFGSVPIYAPAKKHGSTKFPHDERSLVPSSSIDAEAYRTLRSNLRFSNLAKAKSIIMVTSPSGSEGKSTITANLAVSLAESGQRVVVISADLRRPTLSGIFHAPETARGLTSVLLGDDAVIDCLVPYTLDSGHRLYVLPAGPLPPNPAELLGSTAMGELLSSLSRADVDFVLVDCPPVLPVSDPLAIAQFVDGVILVSVVGQTKSRALREAIHRLERVGADVIGVILNGVPTKRGARYSYAYTGTYGDRPPPAPPSPAADPKIGSKTDPQPASTAGVRAEGKAPGSAPAARAVAPEDDLLRRRTESATSRAPS